MKMVKEAIEPIAGPDMVHHDDFISQHEQDGFKHHSDTYGKEAAGHKKHADHIKSFCKGGKSA
jgi:hypothetical protein